MNFNIAVNDLDLLNIICPEMDKYILSSKHSIDMITTSIKLITRNNKDYENYILITLTRCDIILSITDNDVIIGIALLQLDFNNAIYVYGMYTSETTEKKYGTYLMNIIKYLCKIMNITKILLSPIDNDVKSFYIKNNFNKNHQNELWYFNLLSM